MSESFTLSQAVMKLVGPVTPVGETHEDARRLQNIRRLTLLIDSLLFEVNDAAISATRPERSMRNIGQHAANFLDEVRKS